MRGRHAADAKGVAGYGWIPAGAGETPRKRMRGGMRRVDPRGCGGDAWLVCAKAGDEGGSPRVRGRLRYLARTTCSEGWIPAGAGETPAQQAAVGSVRVDPRGCGGDAPCRPRLSKRKGGSPRVRGRRELPARGFRLRGWIPAGAGETRRSCRRAWKSRVDPRGCGGDTPWLVTLPLTAGGSPRVRGRLMSLTASSARAGWIPAGAGETRSRTNMASPSWVDPRGCGGDLPQPVDATVRTGGSPRVRGRLPTAWCVVEYQGWIPAGAGETLAAIKKATIGRVDPRGCGGDAMIVFWTAAL